LRHRYRGPDVVKTLEHAVSEHGKPRRIFCDNGTELVSNDLDLWAYPSGVELDFSRSGKPTDNAFVEAFNSWFRKECLNQHWFLDPNDARSKIEHWRNDRGPNPPGISAKLYRSHRIMAYATGFFSPKRADAIEPDSHSRTGSI